MVEKFKSFTLIELLIALSILSIIAFLSANSFISIRRATEWNNQNMETRKAIHNLIEGLDNELSSVIFISSNRRTRLYSPRTENSGVKINDLRFCYIDPISFYEMNKRDELIEVQYRIEQNSDFSGKYKVEKEVWYLAVHPDKQEERDPDTKHLLIKNADFFMFRFYSEGKWYESWDTEKRDKLPDMIELDFSVNGKEYKEYFNVYISEL